METGAPLRTIVVGAGAIAQMHHLPTLTERRDLFQIDALVDVNEATAQQVAARFGIANVTVDLGAALAIPGVEAVLVVHGGSHQDATLQALAAGKHVFVEKPLGYSLAQTQRIADVAKQSRGRLMVGYQKRYAPAWRTAKPLVAAMEGLRYVEVVVLHPDDSDYQSHHALLPLRGPASPEPERKGIAKAHQDVVQGPLAPLLQEIVGDAAPSSHRVAAKVLTESLIHDLDLLRDALGEPEAVVNAHQWNEGLAQHALVRFQGGVHAAISWVAVPGLKDYDERVTFVGTTSRVSLRFFSPYLRHTPPKLTVERMHGGELIVEDRVVSYDDPFRLELHHFRACIREGRAPETSVDDALGDARFIQSLARALQASR